MREQVNLLLLTVWQCPRIREGYVPRPTTNSNESIIIIVIKCLGKNGRCRDRESNSYIPVAIRPSTNYHSHDYFLCIRRIDFGRQLVQLRREVVRGCDSLIVEHSGRQPNSIPGHDSYNFFLSIFQQFLCTIHLCNRINTTYCNLIFVCI